MTAPALISIADVIRRTGGRLADTHAADTAASITSISIDSRSCDAGSLFVALPGTHADGHDFVAAAAAAGASAALVTRAVDDAAHCPQIIVDDTLQALTDLAVMARIDHQMAGGHMVGITGSVGKTGSKEMLAHILQNMVGCHANKSSYNNNIGVPLTIAALDRNIPVAVQELGMNAPGEIADLTLIAAPDIALITRIADSHAGFFASLDDIAAAKAEIFDGLSGSAIAILNRDDEYFDDLAGRARRAGAQRIISFGQHSDAEFRIDRVTSLDNGIGIEADFAGAPLQFILGMRARHWAMNAMGVLAVIDALGLDVRQAAAHLASFADIAGRGAAHDGIIDGAAITLIDDSYNASPASMRAGLESLDDKPAQILVLSDMRELGHGTDDAHAALVPVINKLAPRDLVAIGPAMHAIIDALDAAIHSHAAASPDDASTTTRRLLRDGDTVFIKGSLGSGSWRVAKAMLEAMAKPSTGETPHAA